MALPLPDGRWQPVALEPSGWMALDPTGSLSLPFPLERFRLDLLARTNQWTNNVLQLFDPVVRVVSENMPVPYFLSFYGDVLLLAFQIGKGRV